MSRDVRVEIYGQVFSIRTELDPAYIQQLAESVNAKMHELAHQTDTVDTRRLAILTALNLADELEQSRRGSVAVPTAAPDRTRRLEELDRLLTAALAELNR